MSVLKIITAPNPLLKKKAEPVNLLDNGTKKIMDNMLETMYHDKGVGLAANQVGVLKRIIIIDLQEDDDDIHREKSFYPLFMVNPIITKLSKQLSVLPESCLSVPMQKVVVSRSSSIKVEYLDYNSKQKELNANNWLARVIQHEIDHLEGRILLDYLSNLKRNVIIRKLSKLNKD